MSTELIRCDICNGKKRVLGMGGMEKPCPVCKAIGWIEVDKPKPTVEIKIKKKSGPKPKVTNTEMNLEI